MFTQKWKIIFIFLALLTSMLSLTSGEAAAGSNTAFTAYAGPPTDYTPEWLTEPPVLSPDQIQAMEAAMERVNLPGPKLPQIGIPIAPSPGTETPSTTDNLPNVPGSFLVKRNRSLSSVVPAGYASHVLEPAVANDGKYAFYTANWFAAQSTNNGNSWSYVNPYADFANLCCDQDVVYDPARRAFIWYRQGSRNSDGVNEIKISVSTDGAATWCTYTFKPTDVNSGWTGQWFDYPRITLSNDYLWIATNIFNASDSWTRTVMIKMPLDELSKCSGFGYSYYPVTDRFTFTPVQGATTTTYWATHNSTESMRIYRWEESSGTIFWDDVAVPAWTSTSRGSAVCTTKDGYNPCARTDSRILSGWLANWDGYPGEKMIGFFWNVKQDAAFPKPYTNAAIFRERDRTYVGRPFIWHSSYAWIYAEGAPNARGNIGVSLTGVYDATGTAGVYPHHVVLIDDDFNAAPPGWEMYKTTTGFKGPSDNKWGDYHRARPWGPAGLHWAATGYALDSTGKSIPRFIIFGRERENNAYTRWLPH
jgi:hypothetical protein